jgi:hypothetical protein
MRSLRRFGRSGRRWFEVMGGACQEHSNASLAVALTFPPPVSGGYADVGMSARVATRFMATPPSPGSTAGYPRSGSRLGVRDCVGEAPSHRAAKKPCTNVQYLKMPEKVAHFSSLKRSLRVEELNYPTRARPRGPAPPPLRPPRRPAKTAQRSSFLAPDGDHVPSSCFGPVICRRRRRGVSPSGRACSRHQ